MTDAKRGDAGATEGDAMSEAVSAMARMQAAALGPLNWMGPASLQAFQETLHEISDFVARRLEKDLDAQKALLGCKSLEEVQAIQSAALREAFEDYREETERLSQIARKYLEEATRVQVAPPPG